MCYFILKIGIYCLKIKTFKARYGKNLLKSDRIQYVIYDCILFLIFSHNHAFKVALVIDNIINNLNVSRCQFFDVCQTQNVLFVWYV